MLPAPTFHHLHLNSVDPDRAIDFYVRQFPRSRAARWGGLSALAAPNDVLVLFTKVATPPATSPQTALWHFGWHARQDDRPLASSRGQLYDHIALGVTDLDAWIARLRGEGVTFLENAYVLGDTRAVMIEGPSREAIELVETR